MNEFVPYISGIFSGFAQTCIGHPFDTMKILLQSNKKIIYKPNILYKGFRYPFYFNGLSNGLVFGVNQNIHQNYCNNYWISGIGAGIINTAFITPVDLYKIRNQIKESPKKKSTDLSLSRIKVKMFRKFPNIFTFNPYLGIVPTFFREIVAFSIYFGSYHQMEEKIHNPLISGGLAGIFCWTASYNLDVIKTRIQAGECSTILQAIRMGKLWKGITPCLIRSGIVNSVGFWVYEYCQKHLIKAR